MKKLIFAFIILVISKLVILEPFCQEGKNNCLKCHPINNLCVKCNKDIYIPDDNGGCDNSRKCIQGNNFCSECNEDEHLCKICGEGFFPDENGGCSYSDNCEFSYKGECLKCKENFILIGKEDNLKICLSSNLEIFKNCLKINNEIGICQECKEGFYLNLGDKQCSDTENCFESNFGKCKKCIEGYYLDKKENICKIQNETFLNCIEIIDNKKCDKCSDDYYLDQNFNCVSTNFCNIGKKGKCEECIEDYYLSKNDDICTTEKHCYYGDKEFGICTQCLDNYYMDLKAGKCKLNTENNEYRNCKEAKGKCSKCINGYYLGEDNKCTTIQYCSESDDDGNCLACKENYYLDSDNICINIEHCIHSYYGECIECEDDYYYDKHEKKCILSKNNFKNCQIGIGGDCLLCKEDFYLNQTDNLCYSNKEEGLFYKCKYTDNKGEKCLSCIKDYHLGNIDKKCTTIEGCDISDNDKCLRCSYSFCLDAKSGKCKNNDYIYNEEYKIYFRCNETNKNGTACKNCLDGYVLSDEGLCMDEIHCIEKENGVCQKCQGKNPEEGFFCLNSKFGCAKTLFDHCLKCDNIIDFDKCSICLDNYKLNDYDICS